MYCQASRWIVLFGFFVAQVVTSNDCLAQSLEEAMFARGMAYKSQKAYPEAIVVFDSAALQAETQSNWEVWAEARIKSGTCRAQNRERMEAIDHFQATRAGLETKFSDDMALRYQVRIDKSLAYNYIRLGSRDLSIRYQQQVLKAQELTGASQRNRARTYLNIGSQLVQKNDMTQALTYLEAGLALVEDDPMLASKFWTNLGLVAQNSEELPRAVTAFETAYALRKSVVDPYPEDLAGALLFLSGVHVDLENWEEVKSIFEKISRLLPKCEDCEILKGDWAAQRATMLKAEGDLQGALAEGLKAVGYFSEAEPFGRESALQMIEMGQLYLENKEEGKAEEFFHKALLVLLPESAPIPIGTLPRLDSLRTDPWIFMGLQGMADAAYQRYLRTQQADQLEFSVRALARALDQASLVRRAFSSEEARLTLNGKVYPIYEKAIVRALQMAKVSRDPSFNHLAFEFAEQGKAAVLLEEMALANAAAQFNLPDSLQEQLEALDLNYRYFRQCAQNADPDRAAACAQRQDETSLAKDKLMLAIRQSYPAYHSARHRAQAIGVKAVQSRLEQDEALVEYFYGDSNLVTFLVLPDTFYTELQALPTDLATRIRNLRKTLAQQGGSAQLVTFREEARELYRQVAESWVAKMPSATKTVNIVPDGLLSYVPFEVLLREAPGEKIYPDLPYLIRDFRFSYAYSASLRYLDAPREIADKAEVLACALSFNSESMAEVRSSPDRKDLPALPNALAEAKAIRNHFAGQFLLDGEATESAFRAQAPSYGILHLATHTVFNDSSPDATRIVFAPESGEHDGYLHAFELYGIDLDADLAVLSACQTGDGELLRGEGVMSLGRAFTYAGCRSTIMTLWPLDDKSSEEIMTAFYTHLAAGLPRAEALHQAKIDFLQAQRGPRANPYYWAGFIHSGQSGPIVQAGLTVKPWMYPVGGVPVLLLLILLFLRRRARSHSTKGSG